ncbi:hypothetical protein HDU67_005321 [Dinochytrium kinnereticum]|nr:hypothetical protein HDU67_005321 [Dinochytrium kinnereticum]
MGTSTKRPITNSSRGESMSQPASGTTPSQSATPTAEEKTPSYSERVLSLIHQVSWTVAKPSSPSFPAKVLKHALAGDPRAMAIYGVFLQTGSGGVLRDEQLALAWLTSAASADLIDEPPPTGALWESAASPKKMGLGVKKDGSAVKGGEKSKEEPHRPSSPRPDIPAPTSPLPSHQMAPIMQLLGDSYRRGIGCPSDLNTAFGFLQRAAQLGHSDGMMRLASMYERGDGVVRDEGIAFSLFLTAAEKGSVFAMFKVGQALEKGKGTVVNFVQAAHWYQQATARHHFPSAVRLALLSMDPSCESIEVLESAARNLKTPRSFHDYATGLSTTQHGAIPNAKEMRTWYRRAAKSGYVRAQWLLGNAHVEAAKVDPKEYKKAFYWYHAAAVQGFQPAQWAVGNMYRAGQGVERDLDIAAKWHKAASRSGMEKCNSDAFDPAIVTLHSLTESVAPVWNTAEGMRQPGILTDNLGVPFLPIVTPTGGYEVGSMDSAPNGPLAPGAVFAAQGDGVLMSSVAQAAARKKANEDDGIETEHEGYRNIQSLLNSIGHKSDSINVNKMIYLTTISALKTLSQSNQSTPQPNSGASEKPPRPFNDLTTANGVNGQTHPPQPLPAAPNGTHAASQALSVLASQAAFANHSGSSAKAAPAPLHEKSARSPTVSDILRHYPTHSTTALDLLEAKKNLLAFEVYASEHVTHKAVAELGACIRSFWGLFDHTNQAFRILAALCIHTVIAEFGMGRSGCVGGEDGRPCYAPALLHEARIADVFVNMYARTPEVAIVALDWIIAARERRVADAKDANGCVQEVKSDRASTTAAQLKPNTTSNLPADVDPELQDPTSADDDVKLEDAHPRLHPDASVLDDPLPYLLRGSFKAKLGLWDAAVEDYNRAEAAEAGWVERMPEIWYQRGVCYSNMPGTLCREKSILDLGRFLGMVQVDHRRVPDAHYTIAGNHFAIKNVRLVVDHFAKALEAEAVRFPFLPQIINGDLKTRLTLEVKYALVTGGTHVRSTPWSKVPSKVLRMVEGDEPANSIAKECLACHAVGRTKTCSGCLMARYCSTNCQIAHWIRGHAHMCQMKKMATAVEG